MQTQTATQPQIPPHLQMGQNQSDIIVERAEDKRFVAVFFVGDMLVDSQKKADAYRLGGKLFPEAKCVPNNFVTRCAITPLKQGMMSVNSALIEKTERRNYLRSYTATNIWNPATGQFENVTVGTSGASAGLLFKPIYPVTELGQIISPWDGIVPSGVVYVPGVESPQDVKEAQLFYFPDWIEIISGRKSLPVRLAHLEDIIGNRIQQSRHEAMARVGEAILQSCRDYRSFGKAYIAYQTTQIKDAEKVPGVFQRYDEIAERLFEQLEITRSDSLITDFARQNNSNAETTDKIADAISLLAKNTQNQPAQNPAMDEMMKAIAVLANSITEIKNGLTAPMPTQPPVPTNVAEFEQSLNAGQITGTESGEGVLTDEEKDLAKELEANRTVSGVLTPDEIEAANKKAAEDAAKDTANAPKRNRR